MTEPLHPDARRLLDFWFGAPGSPDWNTDRRAWFVKSADFDAACREAFLPMWEAAAAGEPDTWSTSPEGACARVVLLDQFPRNLFRADPRSFATDAQALALAKHIVATGMDRRMPTPYHRMFCYMPFEHSEALADQDECVRLLGQMREEKVGPDDSLEWAERHRVIIRRFGRFPHRNAVLGRASTPEETAFLAEPGSSF